MVMYLFKVLSSSDRQFTNRSLHFLCVVGSFCAGLVAGSLIQVMWAPRSRKTIVALKRQMINCWIRTSTPGTVPRCTVSQCPRCREQPMRQRHHRRGTAAARSARADHDRCTMAHAEGRPL